MTWNPPLFPDKEENKSANQTEDTMSNSRIQSKALNAKLSWEIIGLDLAKNDLSFVGITLEGEIIRMDRLSYEQLVEFSRDTDPTTFAMEPCCESHYLTNQLELYGHQCRIIPGKAVQNYIDTYFSGQKNDLNDAEALAFLGQQKRLKFVRAKNRDEMQLQTLLTVREHYIDEYRKTLTFTEGGGAILGASFSKKFIQRNAFDCLDWGCRLAGGCEGYF